MNVKLNNMIGVGICLCESVRFEVDIALSRSGLYVQDPCEPLIKPFTEKKPQGASSHEELKDMMKSDDLGFMNE